MSLEDSEIVLRKVVRVFDELGIVYLIGGSVASSVYGMPRFTQDVDFVADIGEAQASALASALGDEFYADEDMIRRAAQRRDSFNVIYLANMYKADVFVLQEDDWAREEMARRQPARIGLDEEAPPVYVASPEDTILQKLLWYRMGDGISDQQWSDVQGMLKVQAGALDATYLRRWAARIGVSDLLDRALAATEGRQGQ